MSGSVSSGFFCLFGFLIKVPPLSGLCYVSCKAGNQTITSMTLVKSFTLRMKSSLVEMQEVALKWFFGFFFNFVFLQG